MNRRFRFWLMILFAATGLELQSSQAVAAPKDAAAQRLADDAINNDYLATKFADA